MPQLPDRQRSGFLQTEVPRATGPILEVGQQFDALAKLGNTISNITLDLQEKRNKADEQQFLTNKDTEDLLATKKFMQEQRLKSIDGAGYTKAITDFVNERKAKNLQEAPSESAKMRYEQSANNFFARSIIDASSYEREAKIKKMDFDMTNNVQARANAHLDLPNPAGALEDMAAIDRDYDGYVQAQVYDQLTGEKLKAEAKNVLTKAMLDGFYTRGNENIKKGLDLITSKKGEPESVFSNALSPTEKAQYRNKFLQRMESDKEISTAKIIGTAKNINSRALIMGDVTESEHKNNLSRISRIKDPYRREELKNDAEMSFAIQGKINESKLFTNQKLEASIKSVSDELLAAPKGGDKFTNFEHRKQMAIMYANRVKDEIEKRNANGVEASVSYSPELKELEKQSESATDPLAMQNFIAQSKVVQEKMGIRPDLIRVTTDKKIAEMASVINRASSATQVATALNHYEKQFGPDFLKAFMEASSEEKKAIQPEYLAVTTLADPHAREDLVKTIRDRKNIDVLFSSNKKGITENDVRYASSLALDDMKKALGGTPSNFGKGFLQAAQLEMKKMVGEGYSLKEASETVKKKYYEDNFEKVYSGRAQVLYPNKKEYNKQYIATFIDTYTPRDGGMSKLNTDAALKEFGIYPTEDFIEAAKSRGKTREEAEANFYMQIRDSGKWITSPNLEGILLVTDSSNGKMVPVRDKNKKPVFRSFSDISLKPDINTLDKIKPSLKKIEGL